jgi:outer membrane protein assembly factor BamB
MLCLTADTGQIVWKKTFARGKPASGKHASNTFATETPASNGQIVVAFIGPLGTLVACDLQGQLVWQKELGQQEIQNRFGTGSSPVVIGDRVLIQQYNEQFARLTCFSVADGAQLWQADRDRGTAWSTPIVWRHPGVTEVVTAGKGVVIAYDLANGQERWRCGGIDTSFSGSLVADDLAVYIGTASPGSRAPLLAVRAGLTGDVTLGKGQSSNAGVLWSRFKSGAGMPSPVVVGENLYFFGSSATCFDKRTGQEKYRARLPGGTLVAGCPIVIDQRILLVNEKGLLMTLRAGDQLAIESQFQVGGDEEVFWATPAIASTGVLVRSSDALYCIR